MLEKNTLNFLNKIYIFKIFTINFKRRKGIQMLILLGQVHSLFQIHCPTQPLMRTLSFPSHFPSDFVLRQAYPVCARLTLDWHKVSCSGPGLEHKSTHTPRKSEHWEHKVSLLLWGHYRKGFKFLLIMQRHLVVTPWHILSIHNTQF